MHVRVSVCIEGGKLHSSSLHCPLSADPSPPLPLSPSLCFEIEPAAGAVRASRQTQKLRHRSDRLRLLRLLKGRILSDVGRCDAEKVGWLEGTPAPDDAAFPGLLPPFPTQQACAINPD